MKALFKWGRSRHEFEKGAFYMVLSSVMLSLFTLFAKFGTDNTSFFLLTFLRFGIPFLLLLPYLLWTTPIKEIFFTSHLKVQFMRAGCILAYQYSIFYYLINTSLLDATVLQNTAPLFMPVLERIFYKVKLNRKVVLSILVSFAGVICILQPDAGLFTSLTVVGLIAAISQAGSQVLYGEQARRESQKTNLFYQYFLCTAFTSVVFIFSHEFFGAANSLDNYSAWAWVNIIALGSASLFNQFLRGMAYQHAKASSLAPFFYFSLIFSGLLDWAIFHRLPNWLSLGGAILVGAGGLIQLRYVKSQQQE